MKALILIELDDEHLLKETNTLFDLLKGFKCELRDIPELKKPSGSDIYNDYVRGFNDCLREIKGEE